jgi:hypothetical protein
MRVACILFSHEVELAAFAQACIRFSPQIALRNPNIIFIEIGKCRSLYSELSFTARIQVLLRRFNSQAQIEIADDIPTSLAFAIYKVKNVDDLPLIAISEFVDPFFSDIEGRKSIGKMIDALMRLGIHRISQFKTLSAHEFPSRFGKLGLFCRQQVERSRQVHWPYWSPPEIVFERYELLSSEFCSDLDPLLFMTKTVLDRVFSRLRGMFLGADQIKFTLELEKYSPFECTEREWTFELITPQSSTSSFLPILRERLNWDLSRNPIKSPVIAITVEVPATSMKQDAQRNLFHSRDDFRELMSSFFGQLEEFLGKGQVFWSTVTEERFPEKSWKKKKLPEPQTLHLAQRYPQRPTRLLTPPMPVTVIHNRMIIKGRSFKIKNWSSVERLSPDWLNEVPSRNYYRVEVDEGPLLWLFSDSSHHYFLHGYYE